MDGWMDRCWCGENHTSVDNDVDEQRRIRWYYHKSARWGWTTLVQLCKKKKSDGGDVLASFGWAGEIGRHSLRRRPLRQPQYSIQGWLQLINTVRIDTRRRQ